MSAQSWVILLAAGLGIAAVDFFVDGELTIGGWLGVLVAAVSVIGLLHRLAGRVDGTQPKGPPPATDFSRYRRR